MITSNVIQRVFYLKHKNTTGTCFTIDIDKKQYFITAKHVISDLVDGSILEIFHEKSWKSFKIRLIGHSKVADVSVFALDVLIGGHSLPAHFKDIIYGQDLYFLGFPYGFSAHIGEVNRNFPLPLVKKGILSLTTSKENPYLFLIDGHNNKGFSGGPVVYKLPHTNDF